MGYLLDTKIISEVNRGAHCHPAVQRWYSATDESLLWISVLVIGEIRKGIERVRRKDPGRAGQLEPWLNSVEDRYRERTLAVDRETAHRWGMLNAQSNLSYIDSYLAASAIENRLTLVTRNVADVVETGVSYLNPFEF